MFKKIVIGGTFNILHEGHESLIDTAFENAESTIIGLTSDEFANRFRIEEVRIYEDRRNDLAKYLSKHDKPSDIVEINDSYGVATIDEDIDSIVVSDETLLRAQEINTIRFKKKLPRLTIIVVPLVLDEKGQPVSNSR